MDCPGDGEGPGGSKVRRVPSVCLGLFTDSLAQRRDELSLIYGSPRNQVRVILGSRVLSNIWDEEPRVSEWNVVSGGMREERSTCSEESRPK